MREFIHCPKCLTKRMQVRKIIDNGNTLQTVCPRCGALAYEPTWGNRQSRTRPIDVSRRRDRLAKVLKRR